MNNDQPAPSFMQKSPRILRRLLSVLLTLFGISAAYVNWGADCSTWGGGRDYAPVFFSLCIIAVGMSLSVWEESPRVLGAALCMLPISMIFGRTLGQYHCGTALDFTVFNNVYAISPAIVCVGVGAFLLAWKRKPILRRAAEKAYTTRAFNAVNRLVQTRGARLVGGTAAVVAIVHLGQPPDTTFTGGIKPSDFSLKSASATSESMPQIKFQALCTSLAAHEGEPGAAGVALDAIKVEKALGPCAAAAKSPTATPLDQFHYARVLHANKSYADAAVWYRKAADQGLAGAQYGLGYLYDNGQGFPTSPAIAAQWYRKAADQDHIDALLSLGAFEWNSRGSLQDKAQAIQHMRRAAALGDKTAKENLKMMEEDKADNDKLDGYAKSLGFFGVLMRDLQKHHERNGYYDNNASGQSKYDRDAAEVARANEQRKREEQEIDARRKSYNESVCAAAGKQFNGLAGCF